jgi:hypothetical protein
MKRSQNVHTFISVDGGSLLRKRAFSSFRRNMFFGLSLGRMLLSFEREQNEVVFLLRNQKIVKRALQ